jgi:hypothetical protein
VFEKLLSEVLMKAGEFTAQGIANSLNAMAQLDHYDKAVFDKLLSEVLVKAGEFDAQDIANSLLALATTQHYNEEAQSLLLATLARQPASLIVTETLSQCYQFFLALSLEQPGWDPQPPWNRRGWKKMCGRAWSTQVALTNSSKLHMEVSKTLDSMGIAHTNESVVGTLSVDIEILGSAGSGKQVVVEVDGPSHFCRNDLQRELGPTLFKQRLLAKQGWVCVSVPYFEWGRLRGRDQRAAYLKQKLA